jgi:hypothetical protein
MTGAPKENGQMIIDVRDINEIEKTEIKMQ